MKSRVNCVLAVRMFSVSVTAAAAEAPYPPSPVIADMLLDWSTHRRDAIGLVQCHPRELVSKEAGRTMSILKTRRNPRMLNRLDAAALPRVADRQFLALLGQPPPRSEPASRPVGPITAVDV